MSQFIFVPVNQTLSQALHGMKHTMKEFWQPQKIKHRKSAKLAQTVENGYLLWLTTV